MEHLACGWSRRDPSQLLRYDCSGVIDSWDSKLQQRLRRTCGDAFNSPRPAEPLAYECAGRNVGVKVAAGKPVLDCAHRPFAAGVWDVDVVGLSEALRQRFNASHGRRAGRPL